VNIGFVVYGSIDTLTGGYLYDKHMTEHLTVRGHRVDILSLPVKCHPFKFGDNFTSFLIRRVAEGGYDLLLQDELCHPSLFLLNHRLRRRVSTPIVAVVHHLLCQEPRPRGLNSLMALPEAAFLDSVDGFIFNSRSTQQAVFQLSPAHRPFVVAQPGGDRFRNRISAAWIKERSLQPGPLRLLYVGLVIERKGLLPLLEALADVDRDHWRLEVVGDTSLVPDYVWRVQQTIDAHGLASNVRLSGTLSKEALAARFIDSHLLCMPFAYEGFGIVTLEAMNFGMPVLGSTNGATPELVRYGGNGLLFDRGDLHALAAAVRELHTDRRRLLGMSVAAHEAARVHPTWNESMQRIERFLEGILKTSRYP
jgi:glycosyltransferase involved in cell wall biosynthesis